MHKMIIALIAVAGIFTAGCQSMGGGDKSSALSKSDQKFLTASAQDSISEVAVSEMAVKKATNPQVKAFAQRMVADHTAMNDEMKSMARQKGVSIPKRPDEQHAQQSAALSAMNGAEFDKAYMAAQVADHSKTVAKFEDQAKSAKDPEVRAFASRHAGMMRQHLNEAQRINDSLSTGMQRGTGMGAGTGTGSGTGTGTGTAGGGATGNQQRR